MAYIEHMFDTRPMARRPHPRLAAAQARTAESMRQAAQQLREEHGPVKPEVRSGLSRLLEAVADQQGSAGVYVWGGASAVTHALQAQPLDQSLAETDRRQRERREWAHVDVSPDGLSAASSTGDTPQ